eukprot:UN12258
MDIFWRTSYKDFDTVNDWFTRHLLPDSENANYRSVRPIAEGADIIVSPADCRVTGFTEVYPDQENLDKNLKKFSIP